MTEAAVRDRLGVPEAIHPIEAAVFWWYPLAPTEVLILRFAHGSYLDTVVVPRDEIMRLPPRD
jgi:hypothetical protein